MRPIETVLHEVKRRGVDVAALRALELFAADGTGHLLDYCARVASVEAWEIDAERFERLAQIPGILARKVDTYEEIATTDRRYDLVIADAYILSGRRHEHFDIFPSIPRILSPQGIIVMNVVPSSARSRVQFPRAFDEEHVRARCAFYGLDADRDLTPDDFGEAYGKKLEAFGRRLDWYFTEPRTTIDYLVLKTSLLDPIDPLHA